MTKPAWMAPNPDLMPDTETLYRRLARAEAKLGQKLALGGTYVTQGNGDNRRARRARAAQERKHEQARKAATTTDTVITAVDWERRIVTFSGAPE